MNRYSCTLAMIVSLLSAAASFGQTRVRPTAAAVDQGVGDLDRLSRSMRQMNRGLRRDGEQTSLYTIAPRQLRQLQQAGIASPLTTLSQSQAYYRVAPGITAQMDQPSYLVPAKDDKKKGKTNVASRRDGVFVELIPANTVFILRPDLPSILAGRQPQPLNPRLRGQRVDRRIDRRIDGRHRGRIEPIRIQNKIQPPRQQPWRTQSRQIQPTRLIPSR